MPIETTPVATIAGRPIEPPAEWPIVYGTAPAQAAYTMSLADALAVVDEAGGFAVTLQLAALAVQRIFALAALPTEHPARARVLCFDQRLEWARKRAVGSYNVRRNTGERFRVGDRFETADLLPREKYAEYSLDGEGDGALPYTAVGVLADLLDQVGADWTLAPQSVTEVEVEDLVLDGLTVAEAIDEVFRSYLPGLALYVNAAGRVIVTDTLDRSESAAINGRRVQWGGSEFPMLVNNAGLRPVAVRVLFDRRFGLALTFNATAGQGTDGDGGVFGLTNFAPVPDPELVVNGRTVATGTLVPLLGGFGLIAAWQDDQANPWPSTSYGPIDESFVRHHLASSFRFAMGQVTRLAGAPNPVLGARVRTLGDHYRLTMRPSRELLGRISRLDLERVGIVDRGSGARGIPQVFADYLVRPSWLGVKRSETDGAIAWAVRSSDQAAPFRLVWVDRGSFVFRLDPRTDLYGNSDRVLPGLPAADTVPGDLVEFNRTGQQALAFFDHVELAAGWRATAQVSVTQAAPNDARRLHAETIEASDSDLLSLLGLGPGEDADGNEGAAGGVGPTYGSVIEIRIQAGEGIEAQYQWDGAADFAEQMAAVFSDAAAEPPAELLTNGRVLRDVALAVAASVYEPLLDRPRAAAAPVALDPSLEPTGALRSVVHMIDRDGAQRSVLSIPPAQGARNWQRFLAPGTRKLLRRVATGLQ